MKKVHRSLGHPSSEKLTSLYKNKGSWTSKIQKTIEKVCNNCNICKKQSRARSRPKVGLPKSTSVNNKVSLDLKNVSTLINETSDKRYVLYLNDEFSKFIRGIVLKNKEKETIIEAVLSDSRTFGFPRNGYHADNGTEFSNEDFRTLCNRAGIKLSLSPALSPWSNGGNERRHAVVDLAVKKLLADNPGLKVNKAVEMACYCRNIEIGPLGYSQQITFGVGSHIPGISDGNIATDSIITDSEAI